MGPVSPPPLKLYGRDREIAALLESFEHVARGHGEVLLVPGPPGVGKTALVQALATPIRARNGFFVQGKFDQYQQSTPYFAFRQALADLCRQLQAGDARQRRRWRASILEAVGDLGQLLIDLVPELETFLGAQPALTDITPQEARHRFAGLFREFLAVVCRPEHPLVLFLDDWQWADSASLQLLGQLRVGSALRYLLVVASYRDNEVEASHPLVAAVGDLRGQAVPVETLHVRDLGLDDVRMLVADTLTPAVDHPERLAALVHQRTLGNPFFVRAFLGFLQELGLVAFDEARGRWHWQADETAAADLPDDVVDLFTVRLRSLDADSRELLSLAACLGNRFDLGTLSIISGRPRAEVLALLSTGRAREMLAPVEGDVDDMPAQAPLLPEECRFLHDRVQQAAYSLIAPEEVPRILLGIGRLLIASLSPAQLAERSFEVAGDMNAGYGLIEDAAEQMQVVELGVAAARRAYAATAYPAALQFYRAADRFLQRPGFAERLWRDRHDLAVQLFEGRAECEFLEGDRARAEVVIREAAAHARTPVERAGTLNVLIVHCTLQARYPEAISAGREALAALGISLPDDDYEAARDEEIAQVRGQLGGRPISSLLELPVMSDPAILMASRILITMGPPCYRSHQRLWAVIVPLVVNLTLRYGNIPQIGYSHTAFGGLLGWVDDDYAAAREYGEVATRLMTDTFRSPSDQSVFHLMIGSSIRHWTSHLSYGSRDYTDAYETGLGSSNLQYAAYAFGHNMYCRFYQAAPLDALIQESQRSLEFSRTRLNQWAIDLLEGGLQIFGALSGESPTRAAEAAWSEPEYLRRVADHHNIQVTCIYLVLKTCALLVLGDNEGALALSDEAEPLIYTVGTQGLLPWPEHVFARLLVLTALYATGDEGRRAEWRAELERMMGKLRVWAATCPDNFEHKRLLAAAELARIDERPFDAMRLYDEAAEAARAGGFLQWEGMASERASAFWLQRGSEVVAHVYRGQAYSCYARWGAGAKVRALEAEYRASLAWGLAAAGVSGRPAAAPERGAVEDLAERLILQLRHFAAQVQRGDLQSDEEDRIRELAGATARLREEIAARRQAEEALQQSEALYHSVVSAFPEGVVVIDMDGRVSLASPAALAMFGGEREQELLGRSLAEFVAAEDRQRAEADIEAMLRSGNSGPGDYLGVRADGSTLPIEVSGELIRDAAGQPTGAVFVVRDVSARMLEESYKEMGREVLRILNEPAELLECLARVLDVIQTTTGLDAVGIRLQDGEDYPYFGQIGFSREFVLAENSLLERDADGEVLRRADGCARLACSCGLVISGAPHTSDPLFTAGGSFWSNDSLALLDLPRIEDPRDHPRNRCMHDGYATMALVPIRSEDGIVGLIHLDDRRPGRLTLEAIEFLEGLAAHIGAALTRKRAEGEVRRLNAVLEERVVSRTAQRDAFNHELEGLAYAAAHDLRAPLRAIDGFSKIIVEDAAERLTPDELVHLERVRAAAQRMATMIDDLMGLSTVTRLPVVRSTVDVSATALEVAAELRAAQPERRVEFVVAPGMTATADPVLLRLVLLYLLENAWKFTAEHDEARIEVGVMDGRRAGADGHAVERVFFVRDDGAGFDMAGARYLFGAFQRFHAPGRFEGDGIGLASAQRLVLRQGGSVWAEAAPEKGAAFYFTLSETAHASD